MQQEKTVLEVFDEIKKNELGFLPDEGAKAGFMGFIMGFIFSS